MWGACSSSSRGCGASRGGSTLGSMRRGSRRFARGTTSTTGRRCWRVLVRGSSRAIPVCSMELAGDSGRNEGDSAGDSEIPASAIAENGTPFKESLDAKTVEQYPQARTGATRGPARFKTRARLFEVRLLPASLDVSISPRACAHRRRRLERHRQSRADRRGWDPPRVRVWRAAGSNGDDGLLPFAFLLHLRVFVLLRW